MLRDTDIICLASIDWAFNWQIQQEIALGLAYAGNRVLFVENTGIRRPQLKDLDRVRARLRNWRAWPGGVRPAAGGVDVLSPMILPLPYARWARVVNQALLLGAIRRWLGSLPRTSATAPAKPTIVITYVPTPLARVTIRSLAPALSVFYWTDRLSASSPGAAPLAGHERALFGEADLVLTTSSGLLESARPLASRAVLFQTGVRTLAFQRARDARDDVAAQPSALRGVKRPIVGYVGSLRNEMDRALLAETARLAPDLTFVLAGPVLADVSALTACPNVRLLGPLSHEAAVHHMAWFDAGIIPYVLNDYTADIMPVKLLEYLAAGLPVIATSLPPVREFVAANGPVVSIADGAEAFTAALRTALATDTPAHAARRVAIARRHDWSERIATLSDLMEAAIAARRNGAPEAARSKADAKAQGMTC